MFYTVQPPTGQERRSQTRLLFCLANLPGEMRTTITLRPVVVGTELSIVQEGIPDVIPAEACCLGWQESLTLLALLVEAAVPD